MFSDSSPSIAKNECYTTIAILCTIFVSLGVSVLIFLLFYLAYFKPLQDAHKYCLKEQQNEMKQQMLTTTLLEQYDTQNKFTQPKYIYDMQVLPDERNKQSYIKNREHRQRKKKNPPISLSTINENYATDFFPSKFFSTVQVQTYDPSYPMIDGALKMKCVYMVEDRKVAATVGIASLEEL